jgi:hypothetical protein
MKETPVLEADTTMLAKFADVINKPFLLRSVVFNYNKETNKYDVNVFFSPLQAHRAMLVDPRPWHQRAWGSIKNFWTKNSNPELWEQEGKEGT